MTQIATIIEGMKDGHSILDKKDRFGGPGWHKPVRFRPLKFMIVQCDSRDKNKVLNELRPKTAESEKPIDMLSYKFKHKRHPFKKALIQKLIFIFVSLFGWTVGIKAVDMDKVPGTPKEMGLILLNFWVIGEIPDNFIINEREGTEEEYL